MAPFKLKFRMGSGSRSLSQETEEPVQQPLLTRQSAINGSNTTLNSDYNSMNTNNDQHILLPNKFDEETGTLLIIAFSFLFELFFIKLIRFIALYSLHIGYENPTIMRNESHCFPSMQRTSSNSAIPKNVSYQMNMKKKISFSSKLYLY